MATHSSILTISLLLIISLSSASNITYHANYQVRTDYEIMALYGSWLAEHDKSYNALNEKDKRFHIFKDNLKYIDEQNSVPNKSYKLGLTRFADLTNEEYRSTYLGLKMNDRRRLLRNKSDRYLPMVGDSFPDSVDWREKGAVGPIKDQGRCKGSWAFSAIAAVEGANQILTGSILSLSEQELLDCDYYNEGCNRGRMDYAYDFIMKNGGVHTGEDYPYKGRPSECINMQKVAKVVKIDSYEDVPKNNEKVLRKALVNQPVSVAVEAGSRDFQLYQSGVFGGSCGFAVNHSVAAVGYGSDNGKDYWVVRNSWGESWGEKGYIRLERNVANPKGKCGIAIDPSYPVIKTGPRPTPPSPVSCDSYNQCPESTTCCCAKKLFNYCSSWLCCSRFYPVCNARYGTCSISKNILVGVKAMRTIRAASIEAIGNGGKKSSS